MWRNATESVVEKLLQDWALTEEKVPENDCSVPDAATVFSGRDVPQHHQLLMVLVLDIGVKGGGIAPASVQAAASTERLPEQG